MNRNLRSLQFVLHLIWMAAWLSTHATAAEREPEFNIDAGAGYRYDSNVNLPEIDTATSEADQALLLNVGADYKIPFADKWTVKLGYGFAMTDYHEFSEFDLGIHQGQAELGYRLGEADAALTARQFHARLDGDRFLDISQISASLSRLYDSRFYLRGAYTHSIKKYTELAQRDAASDALDADAYYLLDGMRRYWAVGLQAESENAADPELDFNAGAARLTYGHELKVHATEVQLKAQLRFELRDYQNITATIGEQRKDESLRAVLGASVPLSKYLKIAGEASYSDQDSNLKTADYKESVVSVNLTTAF